jgi:nickel superoxide dismutase
MKMKKSILTLTVLLLVLISAHTAWSHCEIPCGIYDDQMRMHMIAEHIRTIEKSMNEILKLQKEDPRNYNQLVRWIMNKEDHANMLQEIVSQYFMTQRIKIEDDDYANKLMVLHKMIVYAMKCKQTIDLSHVAKLRELSKKFSELYFEEHHYKKDKEK